VIAARVIQMLNISAALSLCPRSQRDAWWEKIYMLRSPSPHPVSVHPRTCRR
jgi:hypothetical protein